MNSAEIEELKTLVEQQYGKVLGTTTDFEEFSLYAGRKTGTRVSPSTLKRIWGYVSDKHKPRTFTLDVLAQCIGHDNFAAFVAWLKTSTRYNSSFFSANQLISNELHAGSSVEIGWSPNRLVHLDYLGNSLYKVTESANSKMQPGDVFMTGCFIKGQPLYLPYIKRNGQRTPPFVAGRNGGLTIINRIK